MIGGTTTGRVMDMDMDGMKMDSMKVKSLMRLTRLDHVGNLAGGIRQLSEEHEGEEDEAYDDITGAALNPREVSKARLKELGYVEDKKVWIKMSRKEAIRKGIRVVGVRWIDINKGEAENAKYRSLQCRKSTTIASGLSSPPRPHLLKGLNFYCRDWRRARARRVKPAMLEITRPALRSWFRCRMGASVAHCVRIWSSRCPRLPTPRRSPRHGIGFWPGLGPGLA